MEFCKLASASGKKRSVAEDGNGTWAYLKNWKQCVTVVVGSYAETRHLFLKEKFDGKEPQTPITLDVLQRYDFGQLISDMASYEHTVNEKALELVERFGDTFKGLRDFLSHMLTEKDKLSVELREAIGNLQVSLFHMVIFLERFRDFLQGKRKFQSIFSSAKVHEFDHLIAKVLKTPKPDVVRDMRNWHIFHEVYKACDNVVFLVDMLLSPVLFPRL